MAKVKITLDRGGIGRLLKSSAMRALVEAKARQIAAHATAPAGGTILVDSYTTDRAAAAVVLAHPQGAGLEAKRGILQNAAAAAGLQAVRR